MSFAKNYAKFFFVAIAVCAAFGVLASGSGGTLAAAPANSVAMGLDTSRSPEQAPRWMSDLSLGSAVGSTTVAVQCPPWMNTLPLPQLQVVLKGAPAGTRVEVSLRPGLPFLPVYLKNGAGRLPVAVPDGQALAHMVFRIEGANAQGQLVLQPEKALALSSAVMAGQYLFTVTNWGGAGDLEVSARDAQGQEVALKSAQGRLEPDGSGWAWLGHVETGGQASFLTDCSAPTVYPITVKVKTSKDSSLSEKLFSPATPSMNRFATPANRTEAATVLSGVINTYYPVTASVSAGATSVPVGTSSGASTPISSGDVLILMQMQNAAVNVPADPTSSNYGDGMGIGYGYTSSTAGVYEYLMATGPVTGGSVPVQGMGSGGGTLNAYFTGAATASQGQQTAQLIRVPQYSDTSIGTGLTCMTWNGSVGGVLAFDAANALDLNSGTITVSGVGFRGGSQMQLTGGLNPTPSAYSYYLTTPTNPPVGCFAMKGEGIAGTPRLLSGSNTSGNDGYPGGDFAAGGPGNAGGGGNDGRPSDNSQNAGGGGGSNGGLGGVGGDSWSTNLFVGGNPGGLVADSPSLLAMGGGGGAGTRNNIGDGGDASGAAGGGIVIIRALAVTGSGAITANGADAPTSERDAAGGGGAGGAILVSSATGGLGGLTVTANGGKGGDAWPLDTGGAVDRHGPGGGGGGGAIFLSQEPYSAVANGGASGITTTLNDPYGADPGLAGTISFGVNSGSIPGPGLGAGTTYITKTSSAGIGYVSPGDTLTYTIIVTNPTSAAWTNVAVTDPLPNGTSAVPGSTQLSTTTITNGTVADNFGGGKVYTYSSGNLPWKSSWIESNDGSGSPTKGYIQVVYDSLSPTAYSLRLSNTQNNNSTIARAADLSQSGTNAATISVSYRRYDMGKGESVTLNVSPDGTNWTPIRTYSGYTDSQGNNVTDSEFSTESFAIPASFLTPTFQLSFQGPTLQGRIYFDNVTITCYQQQTTTQSGSDPTSDPSSALLSGYSLAAGQSLTITYKVTLNNPLDPSITGITNKATITADGGINQSATVSNPVLPAPKITAPVLAGATTVSGTSTAPNGSTINLHVNGGSTPIGTASVDNTGHWTVTSLSTTLAGGDTLTATVTVGTATSAPSAPVVVSANPADATPAPIVTSPILAGATSVGGTSGSPAGTRIDVFVDGIFVGTTTVLADHSWSLAGIGPLTDGQQITAAATDLANGHGTSAPSAPVYVSANAGDQTPAPTVNPNIYDGATVVYGTSTSPAGTIIDVYVDGLFLGQTTVQTGGAWSLSGIGPLAALQVITATATDLANLHGTSAPSAPVTVGPPNSGDVTPAPAVTSPLIAGDTSVSGTSPSPPGTLIDVFVGTQMVGQTTVQSGGTWTLTPVAALVAGQSVTATAYDLVIQVWSGPSAPVYVSGGAGATPAPVVGSPINAGATAVHGTSTSPDGTRIDVYGLPSGGTQPVYLGTTTVTGGIWTLGGLSPLVAGTVITATATDSANGKGTSTLSNAVTVSLSLPALLRVQWATLTASGTLAPPDKAFVFPNAPSDPSLPTSPQEVTQFASGASFPDQITDATNSTIQVVFYQLQGNTGDTLRVTKSGGKIVITYTN